MASDEIKVRRYAFRRNEKSDWAIILIDDTGLFTTVSAYGSFGYVWSAHGCKDFREFFLHAERDSSYFAEKLAYTPSELMTRARKEVALKFVKEVIAKRLVPAFTAEMINELEIKLI